MQGMEILEILENLFFVGAPLALFAVHWWRPRYFRPWYWRWPIILAVLLVGSWALTPALLLTGELHGVQLGWAVRALLILGFLIPVGGLYLLARLIVWFFRELLDGAKYESKNRRY